MKLKDLEPKAIEPKPKLKTGWSQLRVSCKISKKTTRYATQTGRSIPDLVLSFGRLRKNHPKTEHVF